MRLYASLFPTASLFYNNTCTNTQTSNGRQWKIVCERDFTKQNKDLILSVQLSFILLREFSVSFFSFVRTIKNTKRFGIFLMCVWVFVSLHRKRYLYTYFVMCMCIISASRSVHFTCKHQVFWSLCFSVVWMLPYLICCSFFFLSFCCFFSARCYCLDFVNRYFMCRHTVLCLYCSGC